uniref:E3 ubiquitin-protein ligase MARCHF5 n=1 Tax=Glossina morsitans morsitans TaxID=37546 RepID=A0A240SWY3_GLOMM
MSEEASGSNTITTEAIIEAPSSSASRDVKHSDRTCIEAVESTDALFLKEETTEDNDKQLHVQDDEPGSSLQVLNLNEIVVQSSASKQQSESQRQESADGERSCWICFATDEDNGLAAWVQPCKCRGSTKWVHQSCLYRWVDEKQKGNALRSVSCQQCQTEYIIVFPQMGKVANILEAFDNLIKRVSPFLAAGVFVGSLYWTAVTYGAVTFLQIVGHKKGLALMENGDPLILLIGLPAIPVALVLGRMIRWEDAVIRLIRNRRSVARKFPLMSFIIPYPEEDEEQTAQNPVTPTLSDPVSATRIFCGALLLPTISSIVGRLLFESIENTLHRTLLGGLTFITVKGILKIYLKQQQYTRRKKRRIVDYTEENVRTYVNRTGVRQQQQQQQQQHGGGNVAAAQNIQPQQASSQQQQAAAQIRMPRESTVRDSLV